MRSTALLPVAVLVALIACGARTDLGARDDRCALVPADATAFPHVTFAGQQPTVGGALTIAGDAVYFDVGIDIGTAQSKLARVPLGGAPEPFATDATYVNGPLVHDQSYLYFAAAIIWGPARQSVVAAPLDGAPSRTLDNPPLQEPFVVSDVAVNGSSGVFWLLWNDAPGGSVLLAHWDGASTTTLASFNEPGDLAVGAAEAFVLTNKALYSVPLLGGDPIELRALSGGPSQLLGINDQALFYSPDRTSIVRRDIGTGEERTIVSGISLSNVVGYGRRGWADTSWLYFATGPNGAPKTLSRVKVDGSEVEVIWNALDRPPSGAVETDSCGIYWLTASAPWNPQGGADGPSILMFRRK